MNNINSAFLETKANNRLNALRLLFANESLSRTEIASFLGISTAAVTSIVNEFLESGLIIQCEESVDSPNKKAGRKQSPLKINYTGSTSSALTYIRHLLISPLPTFTESSLWKSLLHFLLIGIRRSSAQSLPRSVSRFCGIILSI